MRALDVGGASIDAGPTVFTMRWVFDDIFESSGRSLTDYVTLLPAEVLARHAWSARERLDLYADVSRSATAIGELAGAAEARRYVEFCERARSTYETLKEPFILSPEPSPFSLTLKAGFAGLFDLWRIAPFFSLWSELGSYFHDPRLRQLFARYATYCGSSPFDAPATLMLIAHVERDGVWIIDGGMHKLAAALANIGSGHGVEFRYRSEAMEITAKDGVATGVVLTTGERLEGDAIVVNADAAAVGAGLFGAAASLAVHVPRSARSLSAVTWALRATTHRFPLSYHNVFFSDDYVAEFADIQRRDRLPQRPTVYVCAQDRDDEGNLGVEGPERLLVLVNAPPTGDVHSFQYSEIEQCRERAFGLLQSCGLVIDYDPSQARATTPSDFDRLFPGTGGALYGQATHGWNASFTRPTARTRMKGLYLAGGSAHPGAGVPMAALSGRFAAARVLADLAST